MLRRRLFAYALMFTLGIASGYLFLGCGRYLPSIIMMLGIALVIRGIDLEYRPERTEFERRLLIAWIMIGFAVFTCSFIAMNGVIRDENGERILAEDVAGVTGIVTDIELHAIDNSDKPNESNDGNFVQDNYYRIVIKTESIKCHGKIQLNYYNELEEDYIEMLGSRVTLYGELRVPPRVENPGCFNYRSYLYSRGIRFTYSCKYLKLEDSTSSLYWRYRRKMMHLREDFLTQFSEETRPLIKGIVFGDKAEIDESTLDEFNSNSTGHILAVSGLHVGFLFVLLKALTRKRKSKLISAFIITTIVMYGEMTGWSPATARAVLVLGTSILAVYARRTPDLLTSVSASAILILTVSPYNIVSSGFQMSFLALLGLCFLGRFLEYYIGKNLSVLLAIQLSVAPLAAYLFCSFNVSSIFINIPIVFIASLLVPTCIIGLVLLLYAGFTPHPGIVIIEALTTLITQLNSKLTMGNIFVTDVKGLTPGILVTYYLIAFFLTSEWTRIKILRKDYKRIAKTASALLIPIICISIATYNPFLNDEIVFVNVGQGDCTHVRCEDTNILIDGGGNRYTNVGKNTLRPYLLHNNVGAIDLALISHEHMDHYKGLEELSEIYPIKQLDQGHTGSEYRISDDIRIETIWPDEHVLKTNSPANENELNSVYIIHYNGIKLMITGDLTEEDEQKIIERYRGTSTLSCDVLKVGHHGSNTSTSDAFLDAVNPSVAVISVGAHNTYGHPNQQTLDRLNARSITTYRTDLNAAIGIDIRRQHLKVDTIR